MLLVTLNVDLTSATRLSSAFNATRSSVVQPILNFVSNVYGTFKPNTQEKVATTTDVIIDLDAEETVPKKDHGKRLIHKHIDNLEIILKSSNATMIHKHCDMGYLCCYCTNIFKEPTDLKEHTLTEHQNEDIFKSNIKAKAPSAFLVKLDITNLKCTICSYNILSLEDLFVHLTKTHDKNFHTDIKNQIFPFKFDTTQLKCCQCDAFFATFSSLQEHMHKHYRNFDCKECDAGFINRTALASHTAIHKVGAFICRHCPDEFDNVFKRRNHEFRYHSRTGILNKCNFCNEGFQEAVYKEAHLVTVHGVTPRKYECNACDRSYPNSSLLSVHVRRYHLHERNHKCSECDKAFFRDGDLKSHMKVHIGSKNFKCEVCSRRFATKSILTQHMRVHNNDRRYKCTMCDKAFVQKPSLNYHVRAKHPNDYQT